MDRELAIAQLRALAQVPGALRIITSEVQPALREDPRNPRSLVRLEELAKNPALLKSPASFVVHAVVHLEGPNDRGEMLARSAEGDLCVGRPEALLRRLLEWSAHLPPLPSGSAVLLAKQAQPKASFWQRLLGEW